MLNKKSCKNCHYYHGQNRVHCALGKKLDKVGQPSSKQINYRTERLNKKGCPTLSGFNESPHPKGISEPFCTDWQRMVLKDRLKQINNSNSELAQIDLIKGVNLLVLMLLSIILTGLAAKINLPGFNYYISKQLNLVLEITVFLKESGLAIEHPYFFNSIQMVLIYSALLAIIFPIQIFLWLITRWLSKISKIPSFALEQLLTLEAITFWLVFLLATTGINLFPFFSLGSP